MVEDVIRIDLGFVNAFLLVGTKGPVLVDTGLGPQWEALKRGLEAAGFPPERLKLVILTHADPDHAGNCKRLHEVFGIPIAAHEGDVPALEAGQPPTRTISGIKRRLLFAVMNALRKLGGGDSSFPAFMPDILLAEGSDLSAWGLGGSVIHLPGHTRGSIALLLDSGALIAGDVVANRGKPAVSPFVENATDYRASLEKLKALSSRVESVYPGHGSPFPGAELGGISL